MALKDIIKEYGVYALPGGIWHGLRNVHKLLNPSYFSSVLQPSVASKIEKRFQDSLQVTRDCMVRAAPGFEIMRDGLTAFMFGYDYFGSYPDYVGISAVATYAMCTLAGMSIHHIAKSNVVDSFRHASRQIASELQKWPNDKIFALMDGPKGSELSLKLQRDYEYL